MIVEVVSWIILILFGSLFFGIWGFVFVTMLSIMQYFLMEYELNWQQFRGLWIFKYLNPLKKEICSIKDVFEKKTAFIFYGEINDITILLWTFGLRNPSVFGKNPVIWFINKEKANVLNIPIISRILKWSGAAKTKNNDNVDDRLNKKYSIYINLNDDLLEHFYERQDIPLVPVTVSVEKSCVYIGAPIHPECYDTVQDLKNTVDIQLQSLINVHEG